MTVQQFVSMTARTDRVALRRALAAALAAEPPRTAGAYQRLYRRVLDELDARDAGRRTPGHAA